ncbi:MAG: glycoside hydrolase family 13 protein [Candidatus Neomarinimicrobiota bacterium]|nr:glycoside hydrolase family 13 protein [Candidatus Neomarinimicrobiota bacterium]
MKIIIILFGFMVAKDTWYQNAVWYQIFPDRFYNGDYSNDPTVETLSGTWPYEEQSGWKLSEWTSDWYNLESWERVNGKDFYYNAQLRRYGGDLQGIINKLDYLQELGITAIYLNPVFESPSAHKYGATFYHHIDNNLGPNPQKDIQIWSQEVHDDPNTWQWTTADNLFLNLIKEVHDRDMKIIIDGVFNHCGIPFFALEDVKKNGEGSRYKNWFEINSFDDPNTDEDEFDYEGWSGIKDLPVFKENNGLYQDNLMMYFKNVVRRWMDPNGDGNPEDGIDGWRLDVAEKVSLEFWNEFRKWVDEVNPNAYLTGEVWWDNFWDNKMLNASPWIGDHAFHGVMNYRLADVLFKYFIDEKNKISSENFSDLLYQIIDDHGYEQIYYLQNILGSHDTERISSSIINPDRWIDHANHMKYNPEFNIGLPAEENIFLLEKIILFQFMFPGTPYIYYGDEVGMVGADDPDCRKPMLWSEFVYEVEKSHPLGWDRESIIIKPNLNIFSFYQNVIKFRKKYNSLNKGRFAVEAYDEELNYIAISRYYMNEKVVGFFSIDKKKLSENYRKNKKIESIIPDCNKSNNIFSGEQFSVWTCNEQ